MARMSKADAAALAEKDSVELLERAHKLGEAFQQKHGYFVCQTADVIALARLLVEVERRNEELPNSYMDPTTGKWMKRT